MMGDRMVAGPTVRNLFVEFGDRLDWSLIDGVSWLVVRDSDVMRLISRTSLSRTEFVGVLSSITETERRNTGVLAYREGMEFVEAAEKAGVGYFESGDFAHPLVWSVTHMRKALEALGSMPSPENDLITISELATR